MPTLSRLDWGEIDYSLAYKQQLALVDQRARDEIKDTVVFCSHPPVVTLGRGATSDDLCGWTGNVVKTSRGGRATYHGPNQLVIYPIIYLKKRDLHSYLRVLEKTTIEALAAYSIQSEIRTTESFDGQGRKLLLTGVWIDNKKVASIGIAVKKWVTYHGIAINLREDPLAFTGIKPCGFGTDVMTHLPVEVPDFETKWLDALARVGEDQLFFVDGNGKFGDAR